MSVDAAAAIADRVREAQAARRPLRVVGAGTWRHSYNPDAVDTIDASALSGIVEYVPGDLTITVRAGTTLAQIQTATAEHSQWLTLDPFGSANGTIGATISTASAGPLATGFGTPRDALLGVSVITGTGAMVSAGGRVVKNVAGFDLPRLFTGSRGTLGVITEATLRLRGRPAADETIAVTVPDKSAALKSALNGLRGFSMAPMAAELLGPVAAGRLGLEAATTLLLRFGGNARAVAAVRKKASALGKVAVIEQSIWLRYRESDADFESVFRLSDLPTAFVDRWSAVTALFGSNVMLSGSPLRGGLRCAANGLARDAMGALRSATKGAPLIFDSLPDSSAWNAFSAVPDSGSLHGRVRAAFDPVGIMNPGALRLAR